ncbi:hypothetical protein O3G_MSEX000889 [Manduca sexta]|nr:hypothetical protein O3G_MSEX000889 [Manduca sexta]
MSPRKKRKIVSQNKRKNNTKEGASKRLKTNTKKEDDLQAIRRENFVSACKQVSFKSCSDHRSRLLLIYAPACIKNGVCKHNNPNSATCNSILN